MGKEYSHLTIEKRKELARLLSEGRKAKEISALLEVHIASVYREIERGKNPQTNQYDPEYAEKSYQKGLKNKGREPVLSEDKELAAEIAKLILSENLSPEQALLKLESKGYTNLPSKTTVYAAIDTGIIPGVSRESLHSKETSVFSGGTVIIPKWIREELSLEDGATLGIELEGNKIILTKKSGDCEANMYFGHK